MKLDGSDFNAGTADQSIALLPRTGGATSTPSTAGEANPLQLIARMARKLDQQNVDSQGRWLVVDPVFMEILRDEDSRLQNADFGESGGIRNGLVVNNLHGFQVHVSNNLPTIGNGPATEAASNTSNYGIIVGGHSSAVATAEQINKTETYRDQGQLC